MFNGNRTLVSIARWMCCAALLAVAGSASTARAAGTMEVLQPAAAFTRGFDRLHLPPAERYALVIGNANYENVEPLDNPLNDVEAISTAATNAGFKVFKARDVDRRGMLDAIERFLVSVTPGSEAMIYYSGHGVELEGTNYLLPVDIRDLNPSQRFSIEDDSISLNAVLRRLESRQARVNIVMLDACRNNPFSTQGTKALGDPAGLGSIEPAQGTIVLYSAAAGETALDRLGPDDTNPNGVFTRSLLPLMSTPGLEIRDLVQELKATVYATALDAAGHQQRPSYYDGLIGQFYFMPEGIEIEPEPESVPPVQTSSVPEYAIACRAGAQPAARIEEIILADDLTGQVTNCRRAAAEFPDEAAYAELLALAVEQRSARQAVRDGTRIALEAYLGLYPTGRFTNDVSRRLQVFVVDTPPPAEPVPPVEEPAPAVQEASLTPKELTMKIQTELGRLSCGAGKPDGDWGPRTTEAAQRFAKGAKVQVASDGPTADLLSALVAARPGVCPAQSSGGGSSGSGTKQTPVAKPPAEKKCFKFNGETFCE